MLKEIFDYVDPRSNTRQVILIIISACLVAVVLGIWLRLVDKRKQANSAKKQGL
jgi:hypothetical protein